MFFGGEYTIWLNHMLMGFNPCMGIETYVKAIVSNYNKVGFGFDIGNQLVPLMHLGFHGNPNLGLAHDGLVISPVIWGFVLALHRGKNGGDLQTWKVSFAWGFLSYYFMLS